MNDTSWLEDFDETCQDIMEDTLLLDALAIYAANGSFFINNGGNTCFSSAFQRLTDYLTQHVLELYRLEKKLGLGPQQGPGP